MKRFSYHLLLLVLLLATSATATAESGTMVRFGAEMSYTITGGTVTNKTKAKISGVLRDDMTVNIEGVVKPGSTLVVACKRNGGPKNSKMTCVEYFFRTTDGKKQPVKKIEKEGSAGATIKIPSNAQKLYVFLTYNAVRTKFKVESEWKVDNGTTATESGEPFSGSVKNNLGVKVSYTITGAKLIPAASGGNQVYMKAKPGSTIRVSANTASGESGNLNMTCTAKDEMDNVLHNEKLKQKTSPSLSYNIPRNAKRVDFGIAYGLMNCCSIYISVMECESNTTANTTDQTPKKFKWRDVAEDNVCPVCKKPASPLTFEKIGGNGNVLIGCSKLPTKKFEKARVNRPIYAGDGIITDEYSFAVISWGTDGVKKTIKPNTKVLFEGMVDGKARWRTIYGEIE